MKNIVLTKYAVKGIKTLDKWVELSFYKKTISTPFSIKGYNVKGIYGANGSGKSAIIISMELLKGILVDSGYLYNPVNQKKLEELVNKKLKSLEFDLEFIALITNKRKRYHYSIIIQKNAAGKYYIKKETLSSRNASSRADNVEKQFEITDGLIVNLSTSHENSEMIREQTKNLLGNASFSTIILEKVRPFHQLKFDFIMPSLFALSLFIYLDSSDEHENFLINSMLSDEKIFGEEELYESFKHNYKIRDIQIYPLSSETMVVEREKYSDFEKQVDLLKEFLRIFKYDLASISIDKRIDKDVYYCNLIMQYPDYSVHAEFESTGIKKLIKLFPYLQKMVQGDIVFIDELDSNLHDVYLCALLEHLMEYGEGQLCFTTHNIGPMDILKTNKKSIEFLSVDHSIYSWVNNGNYSPSKLYRNGMIEGSPFNVDALDFLGVFELGEDE